MTFINKLLTAQQTNASWLCVGLDPVMERLPKSVQGAKNPFLTFGQAIVEATVDVASAYKPNLGFWLTEGPTGLNALQKLIVQVPEDIPIILDAKFNDIGNTAEAYARVAFETLRADAVTINPYLGRDGVQPFLSDSERGVFLLARTSNASAPDLQDHLVEGRPLYEQVAQLATQWDADLPGTCGLVVGATYPEELARLRQIAPELPFLIPGIGSQGGNLEAAVAHGPTGAGIGPIINSSRGIIYAWASAALPGLDLAEAARAAAIDLRDRINQTREEIQ
jgi:orotidine-5'-phosphate decarboxylase